MPSCTEEDKRADHGKRNDHGARWIDNELMNNFVSQEEPRGGPARDYMTWSKTEMVMEHNIEPVVEVSTTYIVTEIVERTMDNEFKWLC